MTRLLWTQALLLTRSVLPWLPIALALWILVAWLQTPAAMHARGTLLFASGATSGFLLTGLGTLLLAVFSYRAPSRSVLPPWALPLTHWVAGLLVLSVLAAFAGGVGLLLGAIDPLANDYVYATAYLAIWPRLVGALLFLSAPFAAVPALARLPGPTTRIAATIAAVVVHGIALGFPAGISASPLVATPPWLPALVATVGALATATACSAGGTRRPASATLRT